MYRRIAALVALLLALEGSFFVSLTMVSAPAQAMDLNCDDFSSQAAAQANLNANPGDPNGLDTDGDGVACESNPCPCHTSNGGGGGGDNPPAPARKFHTVNLRVAQVRNTGNDVVVGRVPTYRGKFQVQRKVEGGSYRLFKRAVAKNPSGQVKVGVSGSRGTCFRVIVPGTKKFKETKKDIGCIRK